jgi:hypothetical protein
MNEAAPEDNTPPVQLHAEQVRPVVTIIEPKDSSAVWRGPGEIEDQRGWGEANPRQPRVQPDSQEQPTEPRRKAVSFGESPPGYLHLSAALERMVSRAAPDLLPMLAPLNEPNWLPAAVDEGLRIYCARPKPGESRDRIIAIYDNPRSVIERGRDDQLRELGRLWEEAEQGLWRALKDGELQLIVSVDGKEVKVPTLPLHSISRSSVFRKERIVWPDRRAPEAHYSGVPLIREAEFKRWMMSEEPHPVRDLVEAKTNQSLVVGMPLSPPSLPGAGARAQAEPRKRKSAGLDYTEQDKPLLAEMHVLIEAAKANGEILSVEGAVGRLPDLEKRAAGKGDYQSKVKRLALRYPKFYPAE